MTDGESPFDLQLKVVGRLQLQAVLRNPSREEQTFLYDVHLQPVELVLLDATGKPVPSFDSRSTMKFDNTVYRAMYHKLAAGKEEALQTERITAKDNSYTLRWSPYRFEHIAPGTYKAHLVWKSNLDRWKDSETSKTGNMKDIWKGTVESKPVTIEIPSAF